jgi:hypothetical protein
VIWCGWAFNNRHEENPVFESLSECRAYWFDNRDRLIREFSEECWAWHRFEDHDRASCEYCKIHRTIVERSEASDKGD